MIDIKENVLLAPMTTLGVGGPARYFARAETEQAIEECFRFSDEKQVSVFVLGGGSNVLISDQGFPGLVIRPMTEGVEITARGTVTCGAGESWDELVEGTISHSLSGLECMSGIPGLVGGTPVQNVGAYGQEVSETIVKVRCFDRDTREFVELANEDCGFSYRTSIFNSTARDRFIVTSVAFRLTPGGKPTIVYKDLIEYFRGRDPSLSEVRDAVIRIRKVKSMVIDPDDPNSKSAGSFFKNPIVSRDRFEEIASMEAKAPSFPANDGLVKIPAAWLIEQSGFRKGYILGNAGISTNHTLAIINRGGASSQEIVALMKTIQNGVRERFGIELVPEPVFLGF